VKVHAGSCGISPTEKNASFYYIDRWSSNFTWGRGPIPQEGEFIIIPKVLVKILKTNKSVQSLTYVLSYMKMLILGARSFFIQY